MTVIVHQRPLENTRRSSKSGKWVAEAIVNGRTYTATSRMAPANDVARQLVAGGIPDAPMQVYTEGLKGCLVWRSFYRAAGFTCQESASEPVRLVRWNDPSVRMAQMRGAFRDKQGVKAPAGTPVAPETSGAVERRGGPVIIGREMTVASSEVAAGALIPYRD